MLLHSSRGPLTNGFHHLLEFMVHFRPQMQQAWNRPALYNNRQPQGVAWSLGVHVALYRRASHRQRKPALQPQSRSTARRSLAPSTCFSKNNAFLTASQSSTKHTHCMRLALKISATCSAENFAARVFATCSGLAPARLGIDLVACKRSIKGPDSPDGSRRQPRRAGLPARRSAAGRSSPCTGTAAARGPADSSSSSGSWVHVLRMCRRVTGPDCGKGQAWEELAIQIITGHRQVRARYGSWFASTRCLRYVARRSSRDTSCTASPMWTRPQT